MKVAVFGLGYVGTVTAALLANAGYDVIGIDRDTAKSQAIREGRSPVSEPGLTEIVQAAVASRRLTTVDRAEAATEWDVAFVCVGTPSGRGGQLDARALGSVVEEIGHQLRVAKHYAVVAIRSTCLPHVFHDVVVSKLSAAVGAPPGAFGLAVTPEFLREGSAVQDFFNPPFTLIGEHDARAGDVLADLLRFVNAPLLRLPIGEALMVKYAANAFHALKIAFANEIGLISGQEGLDASLVMKTLCEDHKLNISQRYLRPGFAFGGSCLPKDVRALAYRSQERNIGTPVLSSILPSNRAYLEECLNRILDTGCRRVGIVGLTFKPGTNDLRESPMVALTEALIGKGRHVSIYDPTLDLTAVTGANRTFIEETLPHVGSLLKSSVAEVVAASDVLVTAHYGDQLRRLLADHELKDSLIDFDGGLAFQATTPIPVAAW